MFDVLTPFEKEVGGYLFSHRPKCTYSVKFMLHVWKLTTEAAVAVERMCALCMMKKEMHRDGTFTLTALVDFWPLHFNVEQETQGRVIEYTVEAKRLGVPDAYYGLPKERAA